MGDHPGQIRIIAGQWRSRKLRFPAVDDLRPSPDAVRETLFNWLQHDIESANCLDLFAGSGAFGFEAASRGAANVTMVEVHRQAARQLQQNSQLLEANNQIEIVNQKAENYLANCSRKFDIVFIDPPFSSTLLQPICELLNANSILAPAALIYIESARSKSDLPIPTDWHIIRQKTRGLVQSTLAQIENHE